MNLVCINCPRGCKLSVEKINDEIVVRGNSCVRGKTYAVNELTNPLRTLTTTVMIESEREKCLPVITSSAVPKARIMDVMKTLKGVSVKAPVKIGDIIVKDVLGLNVDIIASRSVEKQNMKKILVILLLLLCTGCSGGRDKYYTLSYDNYSLTVGYDDVSFVKLAYDFNIPEKVEGNAVYENELYFFGRHFADAQFTNHKKKEQSSDKIRLSELSVFVDENPYYAYKIDDYELSSSVKENCEHFNGEYIQRNGTACLIGKNVGNKKNVILLQGDIYGFDQDKLYRITISVEQPLMRLFILLNKKARYDTGLNALMLNVDYS